MVVKSKKTSQKGGGNGSRNGNDSRKRKAVSPSPVPNPEAEAEAEELAVAKEQIITLLKSDTTEAMSVVRALTNTPNPVPEQEKENEDFMQELTTVARKKGPKERFMQFARVMEQAALHNLQLAQRGSIMIGHVIKGFGVVTGEKLDEVFMFLAERGMVYGKWALEYLKTKGLENLKAANRYMADVYPRISAGGLSMPGLVQVLRLEFGALPGVAMTMRLINAVAPSLGAGIAEYGGAAASWVGHYLYSFSYYLFTAPSYVDFPELLSVLGEVINYSLGVISGGMITAVPFGTMVQATIFIMTSLAVYDYLSPGATGVIEKVKQLLNKILESLSSLGGEIGALALRLMMKIQTLSENQLVIYVLELYKRATTIAGVPGFYSIAALIKLVQFLAPTVRQTPAFVGRLRHIIRLLQSKGARVQVQELPADLAAVAQKALVRATPVEQEAAEAELAAAEAELATVAPVEQKEAEALAREVAAATPGGGPAPAPAAATGEEAEAMDDDGLEEEADEAVEGEEGPSEPKKRKTGGLGRIRKSRKSSSKKGKSGKSGGAKVKTAKRSTPNKKSKGKKPKKSKKN